MSVLRLKSSAEKLRERTRDLMAKPPRGLCLPFMAKMYYPHQNLRRKEGRRMPGDDDDDDENDGYCYQEDNNEDDDEYEKENHTATGKSSPQPGQKRVKMAAVVKEEAISTYPILSVKEGKTVFIIKRGAARSKMWCDSPCPRPRARFPGSC